MKAVSLLAQTLLVLSIAACGGTAAPASAPASPASTSAAPTSASASPASASASKPAASAQASAAAGTQSNPAPLNPPVKVRWAVNGLIGEAGIFIAQERGYFKEEGLDVDLQVFRSFTEEVPQLAVGQIDFGNGGLNSDIFNAINRDIPLKIVAAASISRPGDASAALLIRQDHIDSGRYKELKDLKGMSLAENSLGTSSQLFTEKILAQGGLTKDDVTFPTIPFPQMGAAFANKGIDAAFAVEPFVNNMVTQKLAKSVYTGAQGFPGGINTVILISPVFAKNQPEAAKRMIYGFLRGQRDYLKAFVDTKDPALKDPIIQILSKNTAVKDPKLYAGMGLSSGDPNGAFDVNVLNEFQQFFLKNGTQQKFIETDKVVDMSYLDYAVGRLGKA